MNDDFNRNFITLVRNVWPQTLTLLVKRRRIMWSKPVGMTNRFPMKQGVLTHDQVCLLLSEGHSCYRLRNTRGEKSTSVRGCVVEASLSVLNMVIINNRETDIPGLTDTVVPHPLGPKRASRPPIPQNKGLNGTFPPTPQNKRASRIRKLFGLSKEDDVHQ